jgi:uncharacterized membrane protein
MKSKPWPLLLIVLLGLLLRLYAIDHQSLWYDEEFALTLSRLSWSDMTGQLVRDFTQPPFHHYSMHAWFTLVGFGSLQSRLLSAFFGTLAIPMIYVLARFLFEPRTALLSAGLLAVSQLSVMYSQEAKPYAELLFLVLCTVYLFILALRERRARPWWGFICAATLMIYTHYYATLVVLSLLLYAVLRRQRYALPRSWWIGGGVLTAVLYAPWLAGVIDQALHSPNTLLTELNRQGIAPVGMAPPWFAVRWGTIFSIMATFNNSRVAGLLASPPWWAFGVGGLLFTLPACWALTPLVAKPADEPGVVERESVLFLTLLSLLPILLALATAAIGVQFNVRYIAFCAAPYYILVARGIATLPLEKLRYAVAVLIVLFSIGALRANYYIPYKENYRDALAYVARERQPGDCWLFLPFEQQTSPIWAIYHAEPGLRATRLADVTANPGDCPRLWVIEYRRAPGPARRVDQALRVLEGTHTKTDESRYFWIDVGLYVPKGSQAKR